MPAELGARVPFPCHVRSGIAPARREPRSPVSETEMVHDTPKRCACWRDRPLPESAPEGSPASSTQRPRKDMEAAHGALLQHGAHLIQPGHRAAKLEKTS